MGRAIGDAPPRAHVTRSPRRRLRGDSSRQAAHRPRNYAHILQQRQRVCRLVRAASRTIRRVNIRLLLLVVGQFLIVSADSPSALLRILKHRLEHCVRIRVVLLSIASSEARTDDCILEQAGSCLLWQVAASLELICTIVH